MKSMLNDVKDETTELTKKMFDSAFSSFPYIILSILVITYALYYLYYYLNVKNSIRR